MVPLVVLAAAMALDAHRWHHRLLVVFAPAATAPALLAQRRAVDGPAYAERDLAVVEVVGDHVSGAGDPAAALRRRFGVAPDAFRVVLVGKDGNVARTSPTPLAAADVAATIDAMPMRRDEMRRR